MTAIIIHLALCFNLAAPIAPGAGGHPGERASGIVVATAFHSQQIFERRGRGTDSGSNDNGGSRSDSSGSSGSSSSGSGGGKGSGDKASGDERRPRPKGGSDEGTSIGR